MDEVGGAFRSSPKMELLKKRKGRGPRGIKTAPSPKAPQRFWFGFGFLSGQQFSEAHGWPQASSSHCQGVELDIVFSSLILVSSLRYLVGPHCLLAAPSSSSLPPATSHPTPEIVPWTWHSSKIFLHDPYPWHFTFKINDYFSHTVTGNEQNAPWVFEPNRMVRLCFRFWCQTPWAWILAGNRNNNGNNNGSHLIRLL